MGRKSSNERLARSLATSPAGGSWRCRSPPALRRQRAERAKRGRGPGTVNTHARYINACPTICRRARCRAADEGVTCCGSRSHARLMIERTGPNGYCPKGGVMAVRQMAGSKLAADRPARKLTPTSPRPCRTRTRHPAAPDDSRPNDLAHTRLFGKSSARSSGLSAHDERWRISATV